MWPGLTNPLTNPRFNEDIVILSDRLSENIMSLRNEKRKRTRPSLGRICALGLTIAASLFTGSVAYSPAQLLKTLKTAPPPKTEPAANQDPLGRETPRSTAIGFLKYTARQDYATAALYMQQPPGQHINLVQFTKEIHILRPRVKISVNLLSDDPNGTVEGGLPPDEERAGAFQVSGKNIDIILARVDDPTFGK